MKAVHSLNGSKHSGAPPVLMTRIGLRKVIGTSSNGADRRTTVSHALIARTRSHSPPLYSAMKTSALTNSKLTLRRRWRSTISLERFGESRSSNERSVRDLREKRPREMTIGAGERRADGGNKGGEKREESPRPRGGGGNEYGYHRVAGK